MPYFFLPVSSNGNDTKKYRLHYECKDNPQPKALFQKHALAKFILIESKEHTHTQKKRAQISYM